MLSLFTSSDMLPLGVVPVFVNTGVALLPALLAGLFSLMAILLRPRELYRLCKAKPYLPLLIVATAIILYFLISWILRLGASPTEDPLSPAADGRQVDWAKVGLELVRQDERDWQKAWLDERDRRLAAEAELQQLRQQLPSSEGTSEHSPRDRTDAQSPAEHRDDMSAFVPSPGKEPAFGGAAFFRGGNTRTGYAGGGEPLKLKLLWEYGEPRAMYLASPLVVDDAVYAASCTVDPVGNYGAVVCLDAATGRERWVSKSAGDAATGNEWAWRPFFSSPALSANGKSLVIGQGLHTDQACELICLDAHTGRVRWFVPTPLHIEGSPAIDGDIVVAGAGAVEGPDGHPTGDPGFVFAVRISDGQLLWKHAVDDPESSPAIGDGTVYIGSGLNGNAVVALRTATDRELRQQDLQRELWQTPTPYPAIGAVTLTDDLVLIGCGNSNFIVTSAEPKAAVLALDRESGRIVWRVEMPETVLGPISVHDGIAVCCALNGEIFALDVRRSGRVLWRQAVRDRSMLKAGAAFTGSHIYVATHDGHLVVLDASDGTVLEDHRLNARDAPGARGLSVSSPFVYGGRVYAGSETGGLRCFAGRGVR